MILRFPRVLSSANCSMKWRQSFISGTNVNIDYFLDEIMDEDHMLDIYDYFKESTTDKIDDALDELGDEFTEEEVRLVRIKFISEIG